jgi:predicted glycosyltransferase
VPPLIFFVGDVTPEPVFVCCDLLRFVVKLTFGPFPFFASGGRVRVEKLVQRNLVVHVQPALLVQLQMCTANVAVSVVAANTTHDILHFPLPSTRLKPAGRRQTEEEVVQKVKQADLLFVLKQNALGAQSLAKRLYCLQYGTRIREGNIM